MDEKLLNGTAVVIGGSMAGLLAARVLADYFAQVTILDRDSLPDTAVPRKGIPQGQHAHALLGRGQAILEELFPGLTQSLVNEGAALGYGRYFSGGGYLCPVPNAQPGLFVSRPLLETAVRSRVLALPNVHLSDQCDVLGWTTDEAGARITGVRLIRRPAGSAAVTLPADLVVDASGRGSRTPAWLESLGYPKPEVELVEVGMSYASRLYQRQPGDMDGNMTINIAPTPTNKRACGMLAQEGDRWIVTLAGYFGDHPPTDAQGYLAFASRLPTLDVYNFIRTATPLTDPVSFKFPSNQRRRYERLDRFPDGLLVIGDAICSFTPIYGQGMTVAAMEAIVLRDCLAAGSKALAPRYFRQVSRVVNIPWSITVGNDMSLSETANRPLPARLIGWYMSKLLIAAQHDPEVTLAFMQVARLHNAPSSLLHPHVALRILRAHLHLVGRRKQSQHPSEPAPVFVTDDVR
jgi:2-polyprenyl-6-methoxyphenol hydroxylase-like FAD-dependent oxidoreductase